MKHSTVLVLLLLHMVLLAQDDWRTLRNEKHQEYLNTLTHQYSKAALWNKAVQQFIRTVDSMEYVARAGNIRQRFQLKTDEDMARFVMEPRRYTAEQIVQAETERWKAIVIKEKNILSEEQITRIAKKKFGIVPIGKKLCIETAPGTKVSGILVAVTETSIKIGSRRFERIDLPLESRAKIWEEENQQFLQKIIKDSVEHAQDTLLLELNKRLETTLPDLLFEERFIPDCFNKRATKTSIDATHWLIPDTAINKHVEEIRKTFTDNFWITNGYVQYDFGASQPPEWVPLRVKEEHTFFRNELFKIQRARKSMRIGCNICANYQYIPIWDDIAGRCFKQRCNACFFIRRGFHGFY